MATAPGPWGVGCPLAYTLGLQLTQVNPAVAASGDGQKQHPALDGVLAEGQDVWGDGSRPDLILVQIETATDRFPPFSF